MANGHFFPGDYFPTGASDPYALAPPPAAGLDAMQHAEFGMAPSWADHQSYLMPPDSSSAAAAAAHFDSALSSLVSSPAGGGGGDDVAIGDLIGRLGSICNGTSANNSCYSTPLSSPPRGAPPYRGCYAGGAGETGRLSRASSSKSLAGAAATAALEGTEPDVSPDKMPATKGAARKRKSSAAKGKASTSLPATAAAATNASPKRSKLAADGEEVDTAAAAEEEEKADEPVRDYIHVRARRGQATDSHSLAERVRRERISERMKLLQSLVPGCNKITGKALMLDEIINYVQSLQRQVEFLSMKLSTMNPEMEYEGHYQVSKDMSHVAMPAFSSGDLASSTAFSSYTGSPTTANPFPGAFNYWDLDLHAFVQQMGATTGDGHDTQHNHPTATTTATTTSPTSPSPHYGFYGEQQQRTTVNHMKVEP